MLEVLGLLVVEGRKVGLEGEGRVARQDLGGVGARRRGVAQLRVGGREKRVMAGSGRVIRRNASTASA